jgi:carboxyl-terminal processing protease
MITVLVNLSTVTTSAINGFNKTEEIWKSLDEYMNKNNVHIETLSARDKDELKKRIKTWMARQMWRMQGYYQVSNRYDNAVMKALEELK